MNVIQFDVGIHNLLSDHEWNQVIGEAVAYALAELGDDVYKLDWANSLARHQEQVKAAA